MVTYRRNFIPGGSYFFTVTLLDRSSSLLVDRIDDLREAMRSVRAEREISENKGTQYLISWGVLMFAST